VYTIDLFQYKSQFNYVFNVGPGNQSSPVTFLSFTATFCSINSDYRVIRMLSSHNYSGLTRVYCNYKLPGSAQISPDLIQTEVKYNVLKSINHLTLCGVSKNCLSSGRSLIVPVQKKGDKTGGSSHRGASLLSSSCAILSNILLSNLSPYAEKTIGGFDLTNQLLIRFSRIRQIRQKNGSTMREHICYSQTSGKLRFTKNGSIVQYCH
jgi:hypothetical protein